MENGKLRNEIVVDIPYCDDNGKRGVKYVNVSFISTKISREYAGFINKVQDIIAISNRTRTIMSDMGAAVVQDAEFVYDNDGSVKVGKKRNLKDIRADIHKLQGEYDELVAKLNQYHATLFDDKVRLIFMILRKNGVEDPDLFSREWWEDCVDTNDLMQFINKSCTKDDNLIDSKKKRNGKVDEFREDKLFSALNKYYKPMSWSEYLDMDVQEITNAISVSGMPKEVVDTIWVSKRSPFEVFK